MSREAAIAIIETAFGARIETRLRRVRRAGRGGLDRPGPPRRGRRRRRGGATSPSRCSARASRSASPATSRTCSSRRGSPSALAPEMRRLRLVQVVETLARSVRMEMDFRLEAAAASEFAENSQGRPRHPGACDRLGPDHPRSDDDGVGRGRAARRSRAPRGAGLRSARAGAGAHPDLSPPCAARRVLPRRHASGKLLRRRGRPDRRGRFRHHGPPRAEGAPLPGRDPVRLHPARLSAGRRGPFRGGLRARRSTASRISRRRSGRSASRSIRAPPNRSRWRSC